MDWFNPLGIENGDVFMGGVGVWLLFLVVAGGIMNELWIRRRK